MSATRIQFDLREDKLREIEQAMKLMGISTKKQYLDYAFTLLKWAQSQAQNGRIVVGLDEKTGYYKELSMPPLDEARKNGHAPIIDERPPVDDRRLGMRRTVS